MVPIFVANIVMMMLNCALLELYIIYSSPVERWSEHSPKFGLTKQILAGVFLIEQEHVLFLIAAGYCLPVAASTASAIISLPVQIKHLSHRMSDRHLRCRVFIHSASQLQLVKASGIRACPLVWRPPILLAVLELRGQGEVRGG